MRECPCAPLGMECVYERYHKDLVSCAVHMLNYHFRELWQSVPIIGGWVEPYRCPNFERSNNNAE